MAKHIVRVTHYALDSGNVGGDVRPLYESSHKTPRAAARRLAELINGKTARARTARPPTGRGGRYTIDGMALKPFRVHHGL